MTLVSEAMERRVVTVPLEATAADAAALARRAGVEHLVVLDGEALAGVLCTCDLEGAAPGDPVSECMTLPVLTVRADAQVEEARAAMEDGDVGCLPVVVGGLVLGLVEHERLDPAGGRAAHGRCRRRHHRPAPH